jgi:hypothetical protein
MGEMRDLQELDAVASERGMVLAFRACEETDEFEPVFLEVRSAGVGSEGEAATIAITDGNGMSLGRYVVSRSKLDAALADSQDSFATDCSSADRLL